MKRIIAFLAAAVFAGAAFAQVPANNGVMVPNGGSATSINGATVDNAAWAPFIPALTCGTATFTVNSARSKTIGKTTFAEVDFIVTAIGTCTTPITFTLPNTAASAGAISGQDIVNGSNGTFCLAAAASATATCIKNAGVAFLVNARIVASGVYENQ